VRGCVVFDLDGTLVDTAPLIAGLVNAMLADRGASRRVTARDTAPHVIAGAQAMIGAMLDINPGEGAPGEVEAAVAEFRARYLATPTPKDCLYPGAREALETLAARGFTLAVWSNKLQALCEKTLDDVGLAGLFAAIVGTGPETPPKPDPAGFDLALGRAGGRRETCVYVGDSELDHQVAKIAGVPMVMMTHGYGDYGDYGPGGAPGVVTAAAFAELPAIIEALAPVA
jgi:phosphoglycolate phosphatase